MKTTRRDFMVAAGGGIVATALSSGAPIIAAENDAGRNKRGIRVPERNVPLLAEADVVVCGGGPAGIAAACCAARHGVKVALLERWPSLGGMATNALVNIWHTSDRKKQVIYGFVQDVINCSGAFIHRYDNFPKVPETHWFDPTGMRVVFWNMLKEAGVRVICNLTAVESVVEDGRIRAVLVDSKTGRKAIRGRVFIDATGDGDVAANAGLPFDYGRSGDGRVQGMTMIFEVRGVNREAARNTPKDQVQRVFKSMQELRDRGDFPQFNEAHMLFYMNAANDGLYNLCPAAGNPLDEEELTRLSAESRNHIYQYMDVWRRTLPAYAEAEISQMGFGIGIRESRRIRGMKTLDREMVVKAVKQPDAIGHGFWMIDIHDPKGSGHTTHSNRKADMMPPAGESYHIPLGVCLNSQIPNLAIVGRCASATHEGLSSMRLQSHCMVMGQGVGTCAALAHKAGVDMAQVDISNLQSTLRKDGVYLENVPA